MELPLYSTYPYHRYGLSMSGHCPHCGQGMIATSDGDKNIRCDQCGRYLSIMTCSSEFDFKSIKSVLMQLGAWFRRRFCNVSLQHGEATASAAKESI